MIASIVEAAVFVGAGLFTLHTNFSVCRCFNSSCVICLARLSLPSIPYGACCPSFLSNLLAELAS